MISIYQTVDKITNWVLHLMTQAILTIYLGDGYVTKWICTCGMGRTQDRAGWVQLASSELCNCADTFEVPAPLLWVRFSYARRRELRACCDSWLHSTDCLEKRSEKFSPQMCLRVVTCGTPRAKLRIPNVSKWFAFYRMRRTQTWAGWASIPVKEETFILEWGNVVFSVGLHLRRFNSLSIYYI